MLMNGDILDGQRTQKEEDGIKNSKPLITDTPSLTQKNCANYKKHAICKYHPQNTATLRREANNWLLSW